MNFNDHMCDDCYNSTESAEILSQALHDSPKGRTLHERLERVSRSFSTHYARNSIVVIIACRPAIEWTCILELWRLPERWFVVFEVTATLLT